MSTDIVEKSIEVLRPPKKPRNWLLVGLGTAATVAVGATIGWFWADKDATDDKLKNQLEELAIKDGMTAAHFQTGDVYGTYITVQIGECALPANVTVVRNSEGIPTELTNWVVSGYTTTGEAERVAGSDVTTPKTHTFEGENYDEILADVQATAPGKTLCQAIRPIDPYNLEITVG